jgi:hypothetical protein
MDLTEGESRYNPSGLEGGSAGLTYLEILPYLEGAAYAAIVIAVLGVPQMLSSYFDIRERRRNREEDRRNREDERRNREDERRNREDERRDAESRRSERLLEAERVRLEERAQADRRHQETLTALMGIIATRTNGGHAASERDDGYTQEILKRLAAIEKALGITTEDDGGTDAENGGTE